MNTVHCSHPPLICFAAFAHRKKTPSAGIFCNKRLNLALNSVYDVNIIAFFHIYAYSGFDVQLHIYKITFDEARIYWKIMATKKKPKSILKLEMKKSALKKIQNQDPCLQNFVVRKYIKSFQEFDQIMQIFEKMLSFQSS